MSDKMLGRCWVGLQFGLLFALAILCVLQRPMGLPGVASWLSWLASTGVGLCTLSVNRPGNFNIHPEPHPDGHLVQEGPYRWVRHPMYVSVLLLAAGASVWLGSLLGWALFVALVGVLIGKAHLEEQWLLQRYTEYRAYRQHTWRLLPWID
jgi:protein-S-isoprenylcysteine O-methyltransferase Ste14